MTFNPTPEDPRDQRPRRYWGAVGLFIVGLVLMLALLVTLVGPTDVRQASNAPAPPNTETAPPPAD